MFTFVKVIHGNLQALFSGHGVHGPELFGLPFHFIVGLACLSNLISKTSAIYQFLKLTLQIRCPTCSL